jgi:cytochrome c-type biogenesis protein CcmF
MTTVLAGNFSLSLAVLAAAAAVFASAAAVRFDSVALLRAAKGLVGAYLALVTIASAALLVALLGSDFRVEYVAHYTERALPTGYKLAALWAGQAGSLLLWAWILGAMSVIAVAAAARPAPHDPDLRAPAAVVATLATVCGFFAALMLFAANPFATSALVPPDGNGLNPMLQDPGMIAHPPLLFVGYAGYTVPFALLIGALIAGRRDAGWLAGVRVWAIISWLFLSAGIILGAQWAYVELGWGGYWAWDPVENASLLPWLTGTALLHSIMAQQHRGLFRRWNAGLIAASFVLCIFGTYLTRSGVIDSVHGFGASLVGTMFLAFLIFTTLFSVALIGARWRVLGPDREIETLVGREGAFLATNVLLVAMTLVTLIGTVFPIISRTIIGREVTVGPPFYNKVVAPLGLALAALMAAGPLLTYGRRAAGRLVHTIVAPAVFATAVTGWFAWSGVSNAWALVATFVIALAVAAMIADLVQTLVQRVRWTREPVPVALTRIVDGNHRRYGGQVVHLGVAMLIAGVVGSSLFAQDKTFQLSPGQSVAFAGRTVTFGGIEETRKGHYTAVEANVTITDATGRQTKVTPQRRFYDKSEQPNSEVAIESSWREDVYVALAGWEDAGRVTAIQVIVNPLVSWIWIGGIVMTIGGVVCVLPRVLRRAAAGVPANTTVVDVEVPEDDGDDKKPAAPAKPAAPRRPQRVREPVHA